jgi:hypothetical protein
VQSLGVIEQLDIVPQIDITDRRLFFDVEEVVEIRDMIAGFGTAE